MHARGRRERTWAAWPVSRWKCPPFLGSPREALRYKALPKALQTKTPRETPKTQGPWFNDLEPRAAGKSGEDRNGTTPENPEKAALFETGAAECGAVAFDATNGAKIDPELRLLIEAWPALSVELRRAVAAIVRTGLAAHSDGLQASGSTDHDESS